MSQRTSRESTRMPRRGSAWALHVVVSAVIGCAPAVPGARTGPMPSVIPTRASPRHAQESQRTRLSLPLSGTWIVGQGYHGSESHRGRAAYALDLVKLDAHGKAYLGRGRRARDWHAFGADVLATADGVVVRAIDRFPDNPVMGTARDPNTLIVEHAPAEFSEYVHLQRGSLRVRLGERVKRGQVLARSGNSGAQTPHLHWAFLASIDPIRTRPGSFSDYELRDAQGAWQRVGRGTPRSGDVIRSVPATQP